MTRDNNREHLSDGVTQPSPERTYVVHVWLKRQPHGMGHTSSENAAQETIPFKRSPEWRLEEAVSLVAAIELEVVAAYICPLVTPRPSTLLGKGWVERLAKEIKQNSIDLLYIDGRLSPGQQRNLEKALNCKVIDRTALILEIFGRRAVTAEGRLQVDLAALQYQKSRLVRSWTHLERQRGGFGFMGGPGESQLELDKRMLEDKIRTLKKDLAVVQRTRGLQRKARQKVPFPMVAFIGYTNAGKSTLFNYFTQAGVFVADLLFATLDPTLRQVKLPSHRKAIFSDTVGFISDLPTSLVAAFRATLEEVLQADLLVHIRDISHPETEAQKKDVEKVLSELGVDPHFPTLEVWNKVDQLSKDERAEREHEIQEKQSSGESAPLLISALSGEGCDKLLEKIDMFCQHKSIVYSLTLPLSEGKALAWLYDKGAVLERHEEDGGMVLQVCLGDKEKALFEREFGVKSLSVRHCEEKS